MFGRIQFCVAAISAVCVLQVSDTLAATVTQLSNAPSKGEAIELSVDDFTRIGNCGGGKSVVNDGCSVVKKSDPASADAYGRYPVPPKLDWIDSQDIDELQWTVTAGGSFTSLRFALTDAFDQKDSHFTMSYKDGDTWSPIWSIEERQENGNLFWLNVAFDQPVSSAAFRFSTKVGSGYDGYGISTASVTPSPVPVPSAALLLLSGALCMAGLRRRTTN